jgi:predicted nuclease of predicted toxin-antitoxin system
VRLLADENVPLLAVRALREAGHDVYSDTESAPASPDVQLMARAVRDSRVIVTFDRDFGALATRGPTTVPGVVLLRLEVRTVGEFSDFLMTLFARSGISWHDHLSVVTAEHVRQRRLVRAS